MADVTVAIPTFRRPRGLERLLTALAQLDTDADVSVLVADNDAEAREGVGVCERLRRENYRWKLESIVAAERGIAQARNALAEHILARDECEFVAMLDDDEWPDPNWLTEFLRVARETGADVVCGAILREFEREPGPWAAHSPGVAPTWISPGGPMFLPGAGNVLLRRDCFEALAKPWFDPAFALTGGEDRDFFARLKAQGKRFAGANGAIAHEYVPASRANFHWVLRRAYRIGNSDMRVIRKHEPGYALARELVKAACVFLLFPFLFLVSLPFAERRAEPLCKLWRAAGKIAAIFGNHYNEYATIHGG